MACVKGTPRFEVTLLMIEREASGRYSVRQPVESSSASAAILARGPLRDLSRVGAPRPGVSGFGVLRMGKRGTIFAIYSPFSESTPVGFPRQGNCSVNCFWESRFAGLELRLRLNRMRKSEHRNGEYDSVRNSSFAFKRSNKWLHRREHASPGSA